MRRYAINIKYRFLFPMLPSVSLDVYFCSPATCIPLWSPICPRLSGTRYF